MDANLLKALEEQGKGGCLESIVLFGRVRCAIERPYVVGSKLKTSETGAFAILDVYALKCKGKDYFCERGSRNPSALYFTKGSMLIYINSPKWVGKDVKVAGSSQRNGVKVRQQFIHKTPYDGITAFAFAMQGGTYVVTPNSIVELGSHDSDIRLTPLEDFVIKRVSENSDIIEYPVTLDSIMSYEGVEDYEELASAMKTAENSFCVDSEKLDVSKIDLHLVYHLEGKDLSEIYEDVEEEIQIMSEKRKKYRKELSDFIGMEFREKSGDLADCAKNIRKAFVNNVAINFAKSVGGSNIKGRVYVDQLLESFVGRPVGRDKDEQKSVSMQTIKDGVKTLSKLVYAEPTCLLERYINDVEIPALEDDKQFALSVIGISTGIGLDSLRSNYSVCHRTAGMDFDGWFFTLLNYPYALGLLGSSLSIVDLDKLYFSYTRSFTNGLYPKENGEIRSDLIYLQTLDDADDKNSFVTESSLRKQEAKYPSTGMRFLHQNGFPAKKDLVELLTVICDTNVSMSPRQVASLENMKWYSKEKTNDLIEKGIVNQVDEYLVLEKELEKDFLTYSILVKKGKELTGITDKQVEDTINKFEEEKGFPLESLQKDGIKLCKFKAGVLSGCAGSGKTTTSDCITMCCKDNLKGYDLVYSTPTGKACRRLAEVVHGTVKTIHSQFGVGLSGDSYLTDIRVKYRAPGTSRKIYILDEMAMANSNLVYEIARSLGQEDIIFFLGDIHQLPPIGKGNPFFLLMKILPCVELGVSKRAAEGSEVNYNTTLINCCSDGVVHELTYNEKDFFCRECIDVEIPRTVTNVWKQFMEGSMNGIKYNEEDIQVITGYAKADIIFSAPQLNIPLQQLLRKNDKLLFRYGDRDFYNNERVIHVKTNAYGMQRYVEIEKDVYKGVVTFGMVNGEMATLVGIVRSDVATIDPYKDGDIESDFYRNLDRNALEELVKSRDEREDMRDDSLIKDIDTYFVKVKTYDVDLGVDVYTFYIARAHWQDGLLVLTGADLGNLDLAYALTTHKMQGSQSPVVILPFGSECNPRFINRNMMNTAVTRSQGIVCMVGTVKGADSPVTKGRLIPSPIETKDMFSLLSE